jgi:hypothetical protein
MIGLGLKLAGMLLHNLRSFAVSYIKIFQDAENDVLGLRRLEKSYSGVNSLLIHIYTRSMWSCIWK